MSKLFYLFRTHRFSNGARSLTPNSRTLYNTATYFDGENNKQDGEIEKSTKPDAGTETVDKKEETYKKLQNLLKLMTKNEPYQKASNVQIVRPRVEAQKKYIERKKEYLETKKKIEKEQIGSQLEDAASKIAETLGGDTKQTEAELLQLYLGRAMSRSKEIDTDIQSDDGKRSQKDEIELLNQYLGRSSEKTDKDVQSESGEDGEEKHKLSMKDLLLSLKVEKQEPADEQTRSYQVRVYKRDAKAVTPILTRRSSKGEKTDIFGAEPLNIFTDDDEGKKGPPAELPMWNYLDQRDLRLSVTHPPANIFEQLIIWTEQGKLWKFPINNEQDWGEEDVHFSEHVFLEHMLEPWCPSSGLIRHFMELVCVGLSKNPYMSVREKHAHIIFYEHYFRHKNQLLIDLGLEPIKDRPPLEERQQATA